MPWHLPEDHALFRHAHHRLAPWSWAGAPGSRCPSGSARCPAGTTSSSPRTRAGRPTGPERAGSVAEVLAEQTTFWVIGGGAVYAAFLPHADRLVVTDVDLAVDGDTWAPALGPEWRLAGRTPAQGWDLSSSSGLRYAVSEYVRDPAPTRWVDSPHDQRPRPALRPRAHGDGDPARRGRLDRPRRRPGAGRAPGRPAVARRPRGLRYDRGVADDQRQRAARRARGGDGRRR